MNTENFIKEWFPKTEEWSNIAKFILESGIQFTDEVNPKWLTGYTNIGISSKPHHKDGYKRFMEENMFMLHDLIHQIFTLDTECSEDEYVKRQIYGELFTFYLTEYIIPDTWNNYSYRTERGCYELMKFLYFRDKHSNIIDYMYNVFLGEVISSNLESDLKEKKLWNSFIKYSKMFKEDMENSRKNYKHLPKNIKNYCMVGASSQNHLDFFSAVSKGAIKNIKRGFDIKLPEQWT